MAASRGGGSFLLAVEQLDHQQQEEDRFRRRANGRFEEQGFTVDTYGVWAQFDKNLEKLPKNKDNLLVFYCGGPT